MATVSLPHPETGVVRNVDEEVADLVRAIWATGNDTDVLPNRGTGWALHGVDHAFAESIINAVADLGSAETGAIHNEFRINAMVVPRTNGQGGHATILVSIAFLDVWLPTVVRAVGTLQPPEPQNRYTDVLDRPSRSLDLG